ncbi:MAG: sigma 54-interacting transcriptional regulator [Bryobacteraceae bacterium]
MALIRETKAPAIPTIDAIAGPLKGASFTLSPDETSIGRDPSNTVSILDSSVSRYHCVILFDGVRFKIKDLDSRNSTFVNRVPVKESPLGPGDEIRVGNSLFVFLPGNDESTAGSGSLRLNDESPGGSTIVLRREQARYLSGAEGQKTLPVTARQVRDLNALLKISRSLNSLRRVDEIERQVLASVLEVAPANHAAILLVEEGSTDFTSVLVFDRASGKESTAPVNLSRTVLSQVLEEGVAIITNDVAGDATYDTAQSLVLPHVSSLLVVPLEFLGRIRGVLYLDASNPASPFDEDLLQLVTAIGSIAAVTLENARQVELLENENRRLQDEINLEHDMVGESTRMREVFQFVGKVAPSEATVLIRGESGTGKELVARAIHTNSLRSAKPFVAINCAAITDTLLESELFGHEKGAFTGAFGQKKGKLESAESGTVFLDEIGELAPALQAKLLRVLQEREFERVGGTRSIKLDVRIIAATNKNLEEAVKDNSFRRDLFYRLNVVAVKMPALRERREDIALLASYFAAKHGGKSKRNIVGISPAARAILTNYDWPGNVRELENAIERAVVLGSTNVILPEDLPEELLEKPASSGASATRYHEGVLEAKRNLIHRAIEQAVGNYTEAAKLLGVHPNYLHRLLTNLNLRETD